MEIMEKVIEKIIEKVFTHLIVNSSIVVCKLLMVVCKFKMCILIF